MQKKRIKNTYSRWTWFEPSRTFKANKALLDRTESETAEPELWYINMRYVRRSGIRTQSSCQTRYPNERNTSSTEVHFTESWRHQAQRRRIRNSKTKQNKTRKAVHRSDLVFETAHSFKSRCTPFQHFCSVQYISKHRMVRNGSAGYWNVLYTLSVRYFDTRARSVFVFISSFRGISVTAGFIE